MSKKVSKTEQSAVTKDTKKKVVEYSDSDEEVVQQSTKKPTKKVVDDSDSDEEVQQPTKKPTKKVVDDSDSDEEVQQPTKKPIKKVVDDSDSDEEEEAPTKKPVKKVVEESDSEDESPKKPIKKTVKASPSSDTQSKQMGSQARVVHISKLDTNAISATPLEENQMSKTQKIGYVRYNDPEVGETQTLIQTPLIQLTQYGIPSLGEYYKDDKSRAFMKVPLDPKVKDSKIMDDKLTTLDEYFESDKTKAAILGKGYDIFDYTKIVREPVEDDDDDDDKPKKKGKDAKPKQPKLKYFKARFDTDFETGDVKTKVYKRIVTKDKNGKVLKVEREEQKVKTMTDVAELIRFMSYVRLIFSFNKTWASKTKDQKTKRKSYGVGLKILQIEYEPSSERTSTRANLTADSFVSDDEDEESVSVVAKKAAPSKQGSKTSKKVEVDSDEEEEPVKPKKVSPPKKVAKKVEVDSDEEEEEPVKPKKASKKYESDDESDESEEEEQPKKNSKSKVAAKKNYAKNLD
jgi:hypothetical protein